MTTAWLAGTSKAGITLHSPAGLRDLAEPSHIDFTFRLNSPDARRLPDPLNIILHSALHRSTRRLLVADVSDG